MSNIAKDVHIVPHIHWDREWYFTTEESRILLVNNLEEVMDMLENNENYPYYVLDGQTAILEDYFAVKPESKARLQKLVAEGRFIVGPWYTQTDEMVVGAESITRNLFYGLKDCKELSDAEPMMIGYLPDSFGQSEKLPQILNGFDITRCIFWRGASERHGTTKNNFYWQSETEGEVLTHLLPLGYAIGKYLPVEVEALKKRMSKYMPVLDKGAINDTITLPNGHDQMPLQKDIFEVMDSLKQIYPERNFFLSKYENVFESIENMKNIDTIKGELLDGKYMRVHRSIFSMRADLKSSNTRIENKITNILEPLASIASTLGAEYHHGLIEHIWKELMKNHAHDSIGCCCSDKVHKAIENRFFLAEDKTDELIQFYKRKIADAMSCEITLDKFIAYNLLPYSRNCVIEGQIITKMKYFKLVDENGNVIPYEIIHQEIIDAGLIDRQIVHYGDYEPFVKYQIALKDEFPSMGYKAYLIQETDEPCSIKVNEKKNVENEFYTIDINKNGTLNILDKEKNISYNDVLLVEDGSDDGDGYDFSPLENDFIVTSKDVEANIDIQNFEFKQVINISYEMPIPKDLDSRKANKIDSKMGVNLKITLKNSERNIDIEVIIDNKSNDHRVRLLVPCGVSSNFSVSDNQFGQIKRPVVDEMMAVWEKEGWDERPDSIYPMLSYVALEEEKGLAVLTNSVREFEIIGEKFDTIAITLFRSVGFLGKEELFRRPGRPSGIKMPTPDSQLIGTQTYNIAIVANSSKIATSAKEYITPMVHYNKMPYNAMKLNLPDFKAPYSYSVFNVDNTSFILSAFKQAQYEEGFIVRGYQVEKNKLHLNLKVDIDKKVVSEVNLNEKLLATLKESTSLEIPNNAVRSYKID